MGKKMRLPNFLSKINTEFSSSSSSSSASASASSSSSLSRSSWSWPVYCQQPKTLSFRTNDNNIFIKNTTNLDLVEDKTPESCLTNPSSSSSESLEIVIKDSRLSERLFFEPEETSSILEQVKHNNNNKKNGYELTPFKESVVLSMDSQDPYLDFKKSMEEMVEAHGLRDWEGLEELLSCYLKVNGKSNHGYIIGAFVDLIVGLASSSSSSSNSSTTITTTSSDSCSCNSCSCSPSSPLSFYTSSFSDDSSSTPNCVSSLAVDHHHQEEIHITPFLSSLQAHDNEIKEN